jgi:hypothetical protein
MRYGMVLLIIPSDTWIEIQLWSRVLVVITQVIHNLELRYEHKLWSYFIG